MSRIVDSQRSFDRVTSPAKALWPRPNRSITISHAINTYTDAVRPTPRRFIVYLEPAPTSKLYRDLYTFFRKTRALVGPNEAHMYHPHCSLTGFLTLGEENVGTKIQAIEKFISERIYYFDKKQTPLLDKIALIKEEEDATTSNVVVKLNVPQQFKTLSKELVGYGESIGVHIRSKPLDHISLAYVKSPLLKSWIPTKDIFEMAKQSLELCNCNEWDLVYYEQTLMSMHLCTEHQFLEVKRWNFCK